MRRTVLLSAAVVGLLAVPTTASAQDAPGCYLARGTLAEAAERPSPLDSASVTLDGAEAKVCYGAPAARDRVVMGELVPFGQPWRTGWRSRRSSSGDMASMLRRMSVLIRPHAE